MKTKTIRIPFNFIPRPYQIKLYNCIADGYKRAVTAWHRRAGKDKTMINIMAKEALKRVGSYYYFFPSYKQGRKILWDGMDRDGFPFAGHIPKEVRKKTNDQEMRIKLKNGSIIQIVGTDDIDAIVGSNPVGCVFSEYALQKPQAWEFIRPIMAENNGWAIFNSCVDENTIVFTKKGIERIKNVFESKGEYTECNIDVYGLNGFHNAKQFYDGGIQDCLKITTKYGYSLTCTLIHPIWNGKEWVKSQNLKVGALLPIQRGQQVWGDNIDITDSNKFRMKRWTSNGNNLLVSGKLTLRTAYLLGLITAEGCWEDSGRIIVSTKYDRDLDKTLRRIGFNKQDDVHYHYGSKRLVHFIEWFGLKRGAKNKIIPDRLLRCPKEYVASFLRGYFDGDGCATKRGNIQCDSISERLIDTLQILLLNFGIISKKYKQIVPPTEKVKVYSTVYRLEICGYNAFLYYKQIGFKLQRKQQREKYIKSVSKDWYGDKVHIPKEIINEFAKGLSYGDLKRNDRYMYRTLRNLLKRKPNEYIQKVVEDNYFYDEIIDIQPTTAKIYDFVIPKTHSFTSNGLISHNTPRGLNHFHEVYQTALREKDWFSELLTIEDTGILTEADIQKERDEGMSENLIQQEYYCSFTASSENILIPLEIVQAATKRINPPATYQFAPIVIGADVARFGDDQSVIYIRQGLHTIDIQAFRNLDLMTFAEKISIQIRNYSPQAVFVDAIGVGAGVVDRLRQMGWTNIVEVNAADASSETKYKNKRAEMWARTLDWLKAGGDIPNNPQLIVDLTSVEYKYDTADRLQLEKKEDMKKRGIMSPDIAEALCVTHAYPVNMLVNEGYEEADDYYCQTDTYDNTTGY